MQVTDCTAKNTASTEADPAAVIQALQASLEASQAEITSLKQQLDWLKRQLFGRKSEKRIIENPDQLDLSALLGDAPPPAEPEPTEEIIYRRRKRMGDGGQVLQSSILPVNATKWSDYYIELRDCKT